MPLRNQYVPKPIHVQTVFTFPKTAAFGTTPTANRLYFVGVVVTNACTLTGIRLYSDSASAGNGMVALFNSAGTQLAVSASTVMAGVYTPQNVPFTVAYAAVPDLYYLGAVYSLATHHFGTWMACGYSGFADVGSFTMPGSITPPDNTTNNLVAEMSTY